MTAQLQLWPSLAARPRQDEQAGSETSRDGGEEEEEEEIRDDRQDSSPDCERSQQKQKSDQVTSSRGFPLRLSSPISRLKQDLEERARNSGLGPGGDQKVETLYVDTTRNVGVVLGNYS